MKILRSDITKMATQTAPDFAFLHKKRKEQLLKKKKKTSLRESQNTRLSGKHSPVPETDEKG